MPGNCKRKLRQNPKGKPTSWKQKLNSKQNSVPGNCTRKLTRKCKEPPTAWKENLKSTPNAAPGKGSLQPSSPERIRWNGHGERRPKVNETASGLQRLKTKKA